MQTFTRSLLERIGWALAPVLVIAACNGGGKEDTTQTGVASATATPVAEQAGAAATVDPIYQRCVTCHQPNGAGVPGAFPPLAGSEFVRAASPAAAIRVVMYGMQGPVTVKGADFNGIMPVGGTGVAMTDEEIASVVTYVRSSWGNNASAVTPEQVAAERAATKGRTASMTFADLKALLQ